MALRQSEEIFRRMIETAQEGVCVIDAHARITYANKRMTEMLAYSEGEMMGRSPFDYLHEDDRDKARQSFEGRRQGIKEVFDVRFVRKDGSYCWGIVSATPIMDDQGRLTGSFSMITDITEHKRAVESLRESEERLRLALMAANQGLYDLNVQTGEAKVNEEYALMLGYDPSDFRETNSKWIERLHPDDRERIAGEYRSYIEGKISAYEVEFRQRTKSGDWKWILSLGKIVEWDSEGKPLRMLGTHTDITDRKRAEEENQKLQAQLMHAQKMEAVGQLAGGIAHDFNNILTAIIGYGNIIQMKMDKDDPLQVNLDSILAAAEKAAVLTQSLLAFSRKQIIQTKPVDLNKIVRNIEKILIRIIGEDIELRTKLAIEELNVLADSSQLEQVIMNLATNARDAMPNGGTLSLETGRTELGAEFKRTHGFGEPGRYALLTVSDTGEGMDEETKKRIFEPFFTTKEVGKGTGLGLAMVYGIIKQHAGFINVISKSGKGTAFIVYFPLIEPEREEKRPEELLSPKRGTETILIAEDDETIRVLTGEVLKQFGYSIIEAKDGKDAIQKFMEHRDKIHLLILDLIMPEKNGKEAYDEIRKSRPDIKVLFVSGYAADIIQKKGILNQGLHFVFKPISPVHLLKKVREVLDKKNYIFPL
jgi:PAS domain S-box-containing protein